MASDKNGTLYIGVTNNLSRRVWEHKSNITPGFTSKYNVNKLIYYESYNYIESALIREKVLKKWIPAFAGMTKQLVPDLIGDQQTLI